MNYYAPFAAPQIYGQQTGWQQPYQANDTQMIFVLNRNEAESYPVAPGCTVVLWDKMCPVIYIKSVSIDRIPSIRTIDYTERTETPQIQPEVGGAVTYVTKDEIGEINGKISELAARCERIEQQHADAKKKAPVKKEKEDEE